MTGTTAATGRALALHRSAWARAVLLTGGAAAAAGLRSALGGSAPAASLGAGATFAVALVALAAAGGFRWRPADAWPRAVAVGGAGAVLLVAVWVTAGAHLPLDAGRHLGGLLLWTPVVVAIATAEEVLLRGALFAALQEAAGPAAAIALTAAAFALLHVPLYGWQVLPLDLAVGVLLGGLRLLTGGVTAPAVAHALADLAAGWLG